MQTKLSKTEGITASNSIFGGWLVNRFDEYKLHYTYICMICIYVYYMNLLKTRQKRSGLNRCGVHPFLHRNTNNTKIVDISMGLSNRVASLVASPPCDLSCPSIDHESGGILCI